MVPVAWTMTEKGFIGSMNDPWWYWGNTVERGRKVLQYFAM